MSFPALTADKEDVTIEVKDSKDAVRAVKAINISKGDTKATFEFETKVAASDLTGQWKIGKATYDFDAIAQLDAIKSAATANNAVKLLAALKAAGITDVSEKDADLEKYVAEIVKADVKTLADVQEAVATANEEIAKENSTTTAVDAVEKATGQVSLLAALQDGFKRVNADWIGKYAGGSATTSTAASVIGFIPAKGDTKTQVVTAVETATDNPTNGVAKAVTPANIQSTIDAINTVEIQKAWDTAWNSAKSEDLAKVVALADYIADDTDEQKEAKAAAADTAKLLEAVIKVNTVAESTATNGTFEKALQELDALENSLVEKYKGTDYAVTDKLNLTTVKAEQLADYRKELKSITEGKQKNQPSDIQHVINKVNGLKAVALLKTVKEQTDVVYSANEKAKEQAALLKAIKELVAFDAETFKGVTIVDSRVDDYKTKLAAQTANLNTSTLVANDVATADATVAKLVTLTTNIGTFKTAITDANNGALTAALTGVTSQAVSTDTDKANFLKALQNSELDLENVIVANKDAYVANEATLKTAATVSGSAKDTLKALQTEVNKVNALTAFNAAKTAEEAKTALDALKYADFQDVDSADKVYVAAKALEKRGDNTYTLVADLTNALGTTSNGTVLGDYVAVLGNFAAPKPKTSAQITALELLEVEAFNTSDKQDVIAEYFKKNFPTETVSGASQSKAYTSLADVKADLEKAIEATK